MTSYWSNHFNGFFLGAAAVIHHLGDLQSFLNKGYLGHSNLKIESVKADCNDDSHAPFAGLCCGSVLPVGNRAILAADGKLHEAPRLPCVCAEDGSFL